MASLIAQTVAFLAVAALVLGFILGLSYLMGSPDCASKARKMGFEHDFGIVQGCMIRVSGRWIPIDNYRVLD